MKRFISFFREAYEELRKVMWPTREKVVRHTIIVLASVVVVMLILVVIDSGLSKGIKALIALSQSR
ncbi:MAG: preprotein translocase subunit SecE [bacterium]|nr:preprotein translocase subunit SecE [bacterium]